MTISVKDKKKLLGDTKVKYVDLLQSLYSKEDFFIIKMKIKTTLTKEQFEIIKKALMQTLETIRVKIERKITYVDYITDIKNVIEEEIDKSNKAIKKEVKKLKKVNK